MNSAKKLTNFSLFFIGGLTVSRLIVLIANPGFWTGFVASSISFVGFAVAITYLCWEIIERFMVEPPSEEQEY